MEDLKKLDEEIVRLAFRLFDTERGSPEHEYARTDLFAAVAAKRSACRPKLLSAEEALEVYSPGLRICDPDLPPMQRVLDADRASILKMADAAIDDLIEPKCEVTKRAIKSAIRSVLSTREG